MRWERPNRETQCVQIRGATGGDEHLNTENWLWEKGNDKKNYTTYRNSTGTHLTWMSRSQSHICSDEDELPQRQTGCSKNSTETLVSSHLARLSCWWAFCCNHIPGRGENCSRHRQTDMWSTHWHPITFPAETLLSVASHLLQAILLYCSPSCVVWNVSVGAAVVGIKRFFC